MNQWLFHNVVSSNGYIWQDGALTEIVNWSNNSTASQHVQINPLASDKVAFLEFISIDPLNINSFLPFVKAFGPLFPTDFSLSDPKIPGIINRINENPDLESKYFYNHKNPEQTIEFYLTEHFDLTYAYDVALNMNNYPFIGHLAIEEVAIPQTLTKLAQVQDRFSKIFHSPTKTQNETTIRIKQHVKVDKNNVKEIAEILRSNINWRLIAEPITPWVVAEMLPILTSPREFEEDMARKISISAIDFDCNCTTQVPITHNGLANVWLDKYISWNLTYYPCEVRHHFSPSQNKWTPLIRPSSLLAAMWYQLTEWLAGQRKYRQCKGCGEWMDVTNKNSNYFFHDTCAGRLRTRKSRLKKAVLKLFTEGRSVKEIANILNQLEEDIHAILSVGS